MAISLLIAGALAAGLFGAKQHHDAGNANNEAKKLIDEAKEIYYSSKQSLESAQREADKSLLRFGGTKKVILDTSMKKFLNSYEKVKKIEFKSTEGMSELSDYSLNDEETIQIKELTDIYDSALKKGAAGAATGALAALASNGTLALVGTNITAAGSLLVAGEFSAAAGLVGSTLSFAASITPLAVVAGPVALFTGVSANMKANENLEKARTYYSEVKVAEQKMAVSTTMCNAISKQTDMFSDLLEELNKMFSECVDLMEGVILAKEGRIIKRRLKSKRFNENELKLIAVTRSLAGAIKTIIDVSIINKEGEVPKETQSDYDSVSQKLPALTESFRDVKKTEYKTRYSVFSSKTSSININEEIAKLTKSDKKFSFQSFKDKIIRKKLIIIIVVMLLCLLAIVILINISKKNDVNDPAFSNLSVAGGFDDSDYSDEEDDDSDYSDEEDDDSDYSDEDDDQLY